MDFNRKVDLWYSGSVEWVCEDVSGVIWKSIIFRKSNINLLQREIERAKLMEGTLK